MSTTHDLKVIGKLNKEIDLVVGNEPVLFVCSLEERPEEKYLVMTYNLFKGKYVIREITHQELLLMLENEVTMEQTFRNGKEIIMTYYKGCDLCAEKYNSKDFDENMLPEKGAYYEIHSNYILNYIDDIRKDANYFDKDIDKDI